MSGQLHALAPGTHPLDLVGPRAGLDDMEKLKFLALLGLIGHPAHSQSLY
jgi:hypothetical protein